MTVCDYVYLSGLRAQSGDPSVEVGGVKYRVVRNGKGRSRLDRWEDKPLADGCVGEINLRDLSLKLAETGLDTVTVTVKTPDGSYSTLVKPAEAMGQDGRDGGLKEALEGMTEDERRVALLDQIRTAPVSLENIEATKERLNAAVEYGLTPQEIVAVATDGFYLSASDELLVALSVTGGVDLGDLQAKKIAAGGRALLPYLVLVADLVKGRHVNLAESLAYLSSEPVRILAQTPLSELSDLSGDMSLKSVLDYLDSKAPSVAAAVSLSKSSVSPDDFAQFVALGVSDPDTVASLMKARISPQAYSVFCESGISDPQTILLYRQAGLTSSDVASYTSVGVSGLESMSALFKHGISGTDFAFFRTIGVSSPEVMSSYRDEGVSGQLAAEFHEYGFSSVDSIKEFRPLGYSTALRYFSRGITSLQDVTACSNNHIHPEDVTSYKKSGITSVSDMVECSSLGVTGSQAGLYRSSGITSFEEMGRTYAAGVDGLTALVFSRVSVRGVSQIQGYIKSGLDPEYVRGFIRHLDQVSPSPSETPASEVLEYKKAGLRPHEAADFVSIGISSLSEIKKFYRAGLDSYDARSYASIGVTSVRDIKPLMREGITAREAGLFAGASITSIDTIREYIKSGIDGSDAASFHRIGVSGVSEIQKCRASGITAADITRYARGGIGDLATINTARSSGVSSIAAENFGENAVFILEDMISYTQAGVNGFRVAECRRLGVTGVKDVLNFLGLSTP